MKERKVHAAQEQAQGMSQPEPGCLAGCPETSPPPTPAQWVRALELESLQGHTKRLCHSRSP